MEEAASGEELQILSYDGEYFIRESAGRTRLRTGNYELQNVT